MLFAASILSICWMPPRVIHRRHLLQVTDAGSWLAWNRRRPVPLHTGLPPAVGV